MTQVLGVTFNPFAEDPYPFYAQTRQEQPITFCPALQAWLVTSYSHIQQILLRPDIFSSRDCLTPPVTFSPRTLEELVKGYLPVPTVLNTDGEEHRRFRAPLMRGLTPARIRRLESFVRTTAHRLINTVFDSGQMDIISQYAYPFALEVVLTLLGIPKEDVEQTRRWSHDWLMLMSVQQDEEAQVRCARSTVAFQHALAALIAERRASPQDDLISALQLASVSGGQPLSEAELVILLQGLVLAGHESTTNMIGTGTLLLLERPAHWQMLCEHPEIIPQTVEEILRYDAPIQMFARTATQEVTIGGVTLPEDAALLLLYGSANRDERMFPQAHEFQPRRTPNPHLAFGHGPHFCVGAALARLEGRIAFEVLCERLPGLRLVPGQKLTHIPTLLFRGYERLDVIWR